MLFIDKILFLLAITLTSFHTLQQIVLKTPAVFKTPLLKAHSYKKVLLAQLSAFLSTRDGQIFFLCTVSKKNLHLLPRNNF